MYFFLSFRDWSSLQNFGFVYIPCRMLIVIQRFGKHYICRLQRKSILLVGSFWQVYVGQGVVQWTGGEEERIAKIVYKCILKIPPYQIPAPSFLVAGRGNVLERQTGLWSTEGKVRGIVPKAAWH
jgi:hypothetical protein